MQSDTVEVAPGITAIDTLMAGRPRYTAAYLVTADQPTLVETGPTTSVDPVNESLRRLGIDPDALAHIVVTHIHLDHAGGVGRLASRFPRATIWVHERGAQHLVDPSKLLASATRVYGKQRLHELFGPVEPVPAGRLRSLNDGDRLRLGGRALDVLYTPGHASHHIALVDSDTGAVFTGDALGIHLPDLPVLRPATPPPDFDIDLANQSIDRIRARARGPLLLAHFGPVREIGAVCDLAKRRIVGWGEIVRRALQTTEDLDEVTGILERETAEELRTGADAPLDLERFETLSSVRTNAMGLIRYWKKRAEQESGPQQAGTAASRSSPAQPS